MKTNKQNKKDTMKNTEPSTRNAQPETNQGLLSRSDKSSQPSPEAKKTLNNEPSTKDSKPTASIKPYVNFAERDFNRKLPVEKVLEILRRWMPRQFELAEVVGKWIWITFPEQPLERVRAELSQLGFHWNNTRKCWQHPCGETLPRGTEEPRQKYTTYHAADQIAA